MNAGQPTREPNPYGCLPHVAYVFVAGFMMAVGVEAAKMVAALGAEAGGPTGRWVGLLVGSACVGAVIGLFLRWLQRRLRAPLPNE